MPSTHALTPGRLTRRVLNPFVMWLNRRGLSLHGAHTLAVRGRASGALRHAPVNPLELDGRTYLVAPRGHVQWTHNLRAAGTAELRLGKRVRPFSAVELADREKPRVLRAYARRWSEVGRYFSELGVGRDATLPQWRETAEHFPVFALTFHSPAGGGTGTGARDAAESGDAAGSGERAGGADGQATFDPVRAGGPEPGAGRP
ncbi:nitroreductase family deazaflavin-dependent oxidoreductase [Streptomyces sp. P38-E01]|uniref:Nitroreductase family deazaflavin-dependent oxidoreductase n=1 Tax=Streptomyces tardus TaxID=2780544 RepID=A0A949JHF7_9ACTN|nr:nitroreductase family deazaflavin-dependent oxidoreductase [Streptomyces tardus]MBU7600191.1 nitroreductase family deazaflavin-dependent oxidoreductase [Streptomyces tardus]